MSKRKKKKVLNWNCRNLYKGINWDYYYVMYRSENGLVQFCWEMNPPKLTDSFFAHRIRAYQSKRNGDVMLISIQCESPQREALSALRHLWSKDIIWSDVVEVEFYIYEDLI